jgi:hypothetical protein
VLGWSVYQYYTALPIEFYAACEGYNERRNDQTKILRFASFRLAECFAGSKAIGSIEKFWPMTDDEAPKKLDMSKERYEAILKRHNIKVK